MEFSRRIGWSLERNRVAQALEERQARLDLTQSNPTEAGIVYPVKEIARAFADVRAMRYQPTPTGLPAAREAVAEYYGRRVSPDRLLLTASTSEAYAYLFKLLCDPGDTILVPRPSYPLFEFLAHLESVNVAHYPMHYHAGWYIDLDALAEAITPRTRAIVFVNPNNPTGSFLKTHEYQRIASFGLPLIVDEVFNDYGFGESTGQVTTTAGLDDVLTFTLSGLSKVTGLPQMKLGWMAVGGPAADRSAAMERLELIADTFLSVGSPVQWAASALLDMRQGVQEQIRSRTRRNLEHLRASVRDTALRALDVEAGWYATVQVPRVRSEEEWVLHLLGAYGVLVQPGYFYDFDSEAFLVTSLLTESAIFDQGVQALVEAAR